MQKEYSGERFIPEMHDAELEIEHVERYFCVKDLVKNQCVLDVACGEGYGSNIMAQVAKNVIGIDIDRDTINHAKEKYSKENLKFVEGNIADLSSIPTNSIDIVVSFETIEHVSRDIQAKFLEEIFRVLKEDGCLVMSTPDKKEYSDRYKFHNQFHVAEFYKEEFVKFLSSKFKYLCIYNQFLEVASFIEKEQGEEKKIQYYKNLNKYNPKGKYLIVVASNVEKEWPSLSMAFMHYRDEYNQTLDELNYCRHEAIVCRKKVEHLDELENQYKLANEELDRRAKELEHRMAVINEQRQENLDIKNQLKLANEELNRRAKELEHRMDVINDLTHRMDELNNQIKLNNEELDRRAVELDHRMDIINQLQSKVIENK